MLRILAPACLAAWVIAVPLARQAPQADAVPADQPVSCTTAFSIDHDCDGYGVGRDYVIGPDADDNDPAVNTLDTVLATYGDVATFLAKNKGLKPAGTWYLSPTGNDKNCAKNDVNRPCATYAFARTKIGSGDVLLIRGGTYDEANKPFSFPSASGTPTRPTVVMAYPGEEVILRRTADGSDPWGMYLNANYAIVDGIQLTTLTPDHGKGIDITKRAESLGVTIRNSEISFFYTNIFGCFGGKDLRVEGNVLHDARSEHNIYTCNNNGNTGHQVGTIIQDNVMYAARWNNIHLNTNYCDGCIIRRNILWSSNETGGGTANIAIQSGFKNGDIDSNVLFNYSGYGLLFNTYTDGQAGIGVPSDMTGNTIANNTMVDTSRDLIGHNFGGQCLATISVQNTSKVPTVDLGHNFYINNVLVHANSSSPNCGALVAYKQVNEADLDWWTTDTWQNNTMFTPDQAAPLSIGKPGVTIAAGKQTFEQFAKVAAVFTGNVQTDPRLEHYAHEDFKDPLRFNLRLQVASPAINAGTTGERVPPLDIRRVPRKSPPEMGAYERP